MTTLSSEEEATQLLLTLKVQSYNWYSIANFALNTGLRAKEIFTLQGCRINLQLKQAYILNSKNKTRTIDLNDVALEIIEQYNPKPHEYLFSNDGRCIQRAGKPFLKTIEALKFNEHATDRRQKVVFHTLRHTFASWLVQKGAPIENIGLTLGHSSTQMTLRYAHLAPTHRLQTVNLLKKLA